MKKQKVVRTYPNGWNHTTECLQKALNEGYYIIMCNTITSRDTEILEYIVEKED